MLPVLISLIIGLVIGYVSGAGSQQFDHEGLEQWKADQAAALKALTDSNLGLVAHNRRMIAERDKFETRFNILMVEHKALAEAHYKDRA